MEMATFLAQIVEKSLKLKRPWMTTGRENISRRPMYAMNVELNFTPQVL